MLLPLINAFRALASNREILWLVQQGVIALSKVADGEEKRQIAAEFKRAAEIKAQVLTFDEAMKRISKR